MVYKMGFGFLYIMGKSSAANFKPIKNSIEARDNFIIQKLCLYIKSDIELMPENIDVSADDDIIKNWASIRFGIENIPNARKWLLMMYYENRYFDDKLNINIKTKKKDSECENRLISDKFVSNKKVKDIIKRVSIFVRRELTCMGHLNAMRMKQNVSNALWIKEVFGIVDVKPSDYLITLYENGYFKDKDLRTRKQRLRAGLVKDRKVNYRDYNKYIKSSSWLRIRDIVLFRDNGKCAVCGSTNNLHIHHKTYNNLFNEEKHLDELITLCRKCHDNIHGREGSKNKLSISEANDKLNKLLK